MLESVEGRLNKDPQKVQGSGARVSCEEREFPGKVLRKTALKREELTKKLTKSYLEGGFGEKPSRGSPELSWGKGKLTQGGL